jgi:hypothetical protein
MYGFYKPPCRGMIPLQKAVSSDICWSANKDKFIKPCKNLLDDILYRQSFHGIWMLHKLYILFPYSVNYYLITAILGPVYDKEKENWRILTNKEIYAMFKNPTIKETIRLHRLVWTHTENGRK